LLFFLVISVVILYRARRSFNLKLSPSYNSQGKVKSLGEGSHVLDFYNDTTYIESAISEYNELTKDDKDKNQQEPNVPETTNANTIITPPPKLTEH